MRNECLSESVLWPRKMYEDRPSCSEGGCDASVKFFCELLLDESGDLLSAHDWYRIESNDNAKSVQDGETWDQDFVFGCICDSEWPVGLDAGEYQQSTYTGADCSLRELASPRRPEPIYLQHY